MTLPDQTTVKDIAELTFGPRKIVKRANEGVLGMAAAAALARRQVSSQDIGLTPWRNICDLRITANDGTRHSGTAWFISPRTLVTAGHCLFVFKRNRPVHGMIRSVRVMPARRGELDEQHSLFGWAEVEREDLVVHPGWEQGDLDFDYGAIKLREPLPGLANIDDKFSYGHFGDQSLQQSAPTLSGYPDGVPEGTQWFEINRIMQVTSRRVFYTINTEQGQSGSPVFFRNGNENIACAIHNFGDESLNSGVRINAEVVEQLNEWSND
jgi:V8-like Glu-specific endopeptidase